MAAACAEGDAKRVIELLGKEKGETYALVNVSVVVVWMCAVAELCVFSGS